MGGQHHLRPGQRARHGRGPALRRVQHQQPLVISAAFGVAWLPWLLFALPGGVLVDRVDRRLLMVTVDWSRVVAMSVPRRG